MKELIRTREELEAILEACKADGNTCAPFYEEMDSYKSHNMFTDEFDQVSEWGKKWFGSQAQIPFEKLFWYCQNMYIAMIEHLDKHYNVHIDGWLEQMNERFNMPLKDQIHSEDICVQMGVVLYMFEFLEDKL